MGVYEGDEKYTSVKMRIRRLFEMNIPLLERWISQSNTLFGKEKEVQGNAFLHPDENKSIHNADAKVANIVLFPKAVTENNREVASGIPAVSPAQSTLTSQETVVYTTIPQVHPPNDRNASTSSEQNPSSNQTHHSLSISKDGDYLILKGDDSITRWFRISSSQKELLLQKSINPQLFSVFYSQLVHFSSCPSGCSVSMMN